MSSSGTWTCRKCGHRNEVETYLKTVESQADILPGAKKLPHGTALLYTAASASGFLWRFTPYCESCDKVTFFPTIDWR
jgi:hypothetical protein